MLVTPHNRYYVALDYRTETMNDKTEQQTSAIKAWIDHCDKDVDALRKVQRDVDRAIESARQVIEFQRQILTALKDASDEGSTP